MLNFKINVSLSAKMTQFRLLCVNSMIYMYYISMYRVKDT